MSIQEEMKKLCYCPCGMGKQHSSDPMAFSIHFLDYGYNYTTLGDAMFNGSAWVPAPHAPDQNHQPKRHGCPG